MAAVEWKDCFLTGIAEVDLQHQYFVALINRLGEELTTTSDRHYALRLLMELEAYARFHFISEENIIMRYALPGLEHHQSLHHQLLDRLSVQVVQIKTGQENPVVLLKFLVDWFTNHTVHEDRTLFQPVTRLPRSSP
ncbi:MAG: bacteriohemerythrin [Magnetococcales bacterium]|nr:bacteriohemerythrin [Magnetococcales bacterium]NGZ25863.1 bacteriohemerythrin [Magnetococcales bacterium]